MGETKQIDLTVHSETMHYTDAFEILEKFFATEEENEPTTHEPHEADEAE